MNKQPDNIRFLQELIRIPSVTPLDPADLIHCRAALDQLQQLAEKSGASCHRKSFSGDHARWDYEVDNLYVEWQFGQAKRHLCFIGHIDVVPVGDLAQWTREPFNGECDGAWIFGRGATDMKGAISAWVFAVLEQLHVLEDCTLSMVITSDEEWAAINGTNKILEWMKTQGKSPDYFIVGEPSSPTDLGSHIKVGRRGSLCGTLSCFGVQGHAAYPSLFNNPNRLLVQLLAQLNKITFDDALPCFPASQFEVIAIESGDFNASAIIPGMAKALWNIRFSPSQSTDTLVNQLEQCLHRSFTPDVDSQNTQKRAKFKLSANTDTVSIPYYSPPGDLAECCSNAVADQLNQRPVIDGEGGTTDGRFIHLHFPSAEIVELGLPEHGGLNCSHKEDFARVGGMHQVDERCSVTDFLNLQQIYGSLLRKLFAPL